MSLVSHLYLCLWTILDVPKKSERYFHLYDAGVFLVRRLSTEPHSGWAMLLYLCCTSCEPCCWCASAVIWFGTDEQKWYVYAVFFFVNSNRRIIILSYQWPMEIIITIWSNHKNAINRKVIFNAMMTLTSHHSAASHTWAHPQLENNLQTKLCLRSILKPFHIVLSENLKHFILLIWKL